jgi:predicted phage-related endonuclease
MTVYLSKVHPERLVDDAGWPAELGNAMEEPIARFYAKMTRSKVERVPIVRGAEPWMLGSIDRVATDEYGAKRIVEIKKPTSRTRHEWNNGIPVRYCVQTTFYMGVTGIHDADVVAAIGDDEPQIYPLPFDADLFAQMVAICRHFWYENVLGKMPPAVDGSNATVDALRALFPRVGHAKLIAPSEEDLALGRRMANVKRQLKALEEEHDAMKAELCARIGDAKGIEGVATWSERKGSVAWGQAAKAHGITEAMAEAFRGETTRTFSLLMKDEE